MHTLVLVRHGKAEPRHAGIDDAARPLSPEGRRALLGSYPRTFSLIEDSDIQIWTSPFTRAFQTADVIAETVGDGSVSGHYSLARNSIDEFLAELSACDADAVIAVGHNPFIEEACERLTGLSLAFSTGTAAALSVTASDDSDALHGELFWYIKGPDWRRWKVLQRMTDQVAGAVEDYETGLQRVFADEPDAQLLDQMREYSANLQALLMFVRPFARERRVAELIDYLDDAAVEFRRLHAYDVLCREIASGRSLTVPYLSGRLGMGLDRVPETRSLEEQLTAPELQPTLYEHACKTRDEAWQRMRRLCHSKKEIKRLAAFADNARHLKWRRRIEEGGLSEEMLLSRYRSALDRLSEEWAAVRFGDRKAVNRFTASVRNLLIIRDRLSTFLDASLDALPFPLDEAYSDLCELCDLRAMRTIIVHWDAADLHGEATYQLVSLNARLIDSENKAISHLEMMRA